MSSATEQQVATSIHTAIGRHLSGMIEFLQVPRREQTRRNGEDSGIPQAMNYCCARQEMGFTRAFCSAACSTLHCEERGAPPDTN